MVSPQRRQFKLFIGTPLILALLITSFYTNHKCFATQKLAQLLPRPSAHKCKKSRPSVTVWTRYPNRNPAKRFRFGKEEQGSWWTAFFFRRNKRTPEQSGLCSDVVRVSLKDLTKPRKINGLQAASKVLLSVKSNNQINYLSYHPHTLWTPLESLAAGPAEKWNRLYPRTP